ncbi:MAG: heavy metal translocating P-type ATPase [Candidatus Veblenbacteria bacterium]|nr:heavy metal translocating P-type ATPase [Candidatus Veblenbacteria bacterium]MDZ4229943.1 heavy metal translocating P-type ATPase [Candidatus Veblenbacteria bacterium]
MAIQTVQLRIHGMNCASCVAHIEDDLKALRGVQEVSVNLVLEQGRVSYDDTVLNLENITAAVAKAGYHAEPIGSEVNNPGHRHEHDTGGGVPDHTAHVAVEGESAITRRFHKVLAAGVLTLAIVALGMVEVPSADMLMLLLALGVLYAGREFFQAGLPALLRGRPDMDTLVALGVGAAFLYSGAVILFLLGGDEYFMDVGIITTFILLGRYLEARAKGKASSAIRELLQLAPKIAHRRGLEGEVQDIPTAEVHIGDLLVVKPGEQVPTDGVVVEGTATLNESMITGESMPVDRSVGGAVIGGTINSSSVFVMRAQKIGADTMLAHIVRLVQEAQMSKAPIQKLVDRVSQYFVWGVLTVAALTFLVWYAKDGALPPAFVATVAVLIIACPCALGLATPISLVVGTGRGARAGVLIKRAEVLEKLKRVTAMVFDKTGTLTRGEPEVTAWVELTPRAREHLAQIISLEAQSEHPLAGAIVAWGKREGLARGVLISEVKAEPGRGIVGYSSGSTYRVGSARFLQAAGVAGVQNDKIQEYAGRGYTVVVAAKDEVLLGFFAIQDKLKPSSAAAVAACTKMGITTIMLTGDTLPVAKEIARQVGIKEVRAEVLPADKVAVIKALQEQGEVVAMVGDGINDSPALAQADVGIALGTGTDIAMESGDIVLVKGDLHKASEAIMLSRATLTNIKQNLFWAFVYNTVGIPVAALGFLNPKVSALAMAFSSVSVVVNALRLRRVKLT